MRPSRRRNPWVLRSIIGVQLAIVLGAASLALLPVGSASSAGVLAGAVTDHPELLAQVQDTAGWPVVGRDPAQQRQMGLSEAAGQPVAPVTARPSVEASSAARGAAPTASSSAAGSAGAAPAAPAVGPAVGGNKPGIPVRTPRRAEEVLPNPSKDGMLSSGCSVGYGKPGAQCVPARAPGNRTLTCAYVAGIFPEGVAVTGPDRLKLDTNGDKIACGPGDTGVAAGVGHHAGP